MAIVFANGRVYTGDGRFAEALVAKHGRVAAAGETGAIRREHPEAKLIDLRGGLMLPGFTDAHCHFLWWAIQRARLDLSEERTLETALARIDAHARGLPAGAWILGGRFDKNRWGRWPTRDELDRVSHGRVAVLRSRDGHSRWANSAALRLARIGRDTPTPEGGEIDRDASGEPTGILRENAIGLLDSLVPQPTRDEVLSGLRVGQTEALKRGLVGIHDLDSPMTPAMRGFQELLDGQQLFIRVQMGIPHRDLDAALALGVRTGLGGEWLRYSNLKMFSDGALGSQTAALEEPYEGTDARGVLTIDPEALKRDVRRAAEAGIAVAIHAIGDRAVRVALDGIEAAPRSGLRHRLEHVQLVRDEDVPRFARLGVIASMQPIHATSDRDLADRHWGRRARRAYPWRTFREAGVVLAFGSDAPVEPIDPLLGIHAAVTRKRPSDAESWYPEQRLDAQSAIAGYTAGAAFAVARERELGTLEAGKWCDAVVLDRDIFREPPDALLGTTVRATITAGEIRHADGLE
jgi:predicted amidohydrolase YtcJ